METVDSREVYRNAWMSVREDAILLPDGTPGTYGVVDKPDFALVVPLADNGLWLVEQYRYPVKRRAWEFPQGSWGKAGAGSALELAAAELREETGLRAATLRHLGHLYAAYGFCSQGLDVYLATGLTAGPHLREPSEQDMRQRLVSHAEFTGMIQTGEVVDAATIAAYHLVSLHSAATSGPDRP